MSRPEVSSRISSHVKLDEPDFPTPETTPSFAPQPRHEGKFYYGVHILTGKVSAGEIDEPDIFVSLTGSKNSTGHVSITSMLSIVEVFKQDRVIHSDYMIIECDENLGEMLVVEVGNKKNWFSFNAAPWYVNTVTTHNFQNGENTLFPCYYWIGDGDSVTLTARATTLKDVSDNPVLLHQREAQLAKRQQRYQWQKFPDSFLPSAIDSTVKDLPPDEQFERVKNIDFIQNLGTAAVVLGITAVVKSLGSLDDFAKFASALGAPKLNVYETHRWLSDVEFGRQMLNGVNPVVIRRCTSIPANFPVTADMVKGLLCRGLSLEEEMKRGHVYICDMKIMDGLATRSGYFSAAPLCLLYVNGSGQLVPIAIQLEQQPGEKNPIFLPTDDWLDWIVAKIYYQCAHSQFHQLATHYLSCHAAMEAYGMATMRHLPDAHPVFKLLKAHFRYTMAINARARATLINRGGAIDQIFSIGGDGKEELIRRASKAYSVHWTNIKRSVKERGVDNPDELPGYYYRDDGLKMWNALERYVRRILDLFYPADDAVLGDKELQRWANDIHHNAFPGYHGAPNGHGFPDAISSKEELVEYCTLIMFTGSVQHSSINFGQYDMYSYVPNAPAAMRQPPPKEKGKMTLSLLLDTLPDELTIILNSGIVYSLSQYSDDEVYLEDFPDQRFTEEKAKDSVQQLKKDLKAISDEIEQRNQSLDVPYTYILPRNVTKSITI